MKKQMCNLGIYFFMATLLVSCGNPHLVEGDQGIKGITSLISPEESNKPAQTVIKVIDVKGENKLNFGTLIINRPISRKVQITSLVDSATILSARFEKGIHFSFAGGKYPGTEGTCTDKLEAKQSCFLDIEFRSDVVGKFDDNLMITTKDGLVYTLPLYGERTEEPVVVTPPNSGNSSPGTLIVSNLDANSLDFGELEIGDKSTKLIEIKNPTDKKIQLESITKPSDDDFTILNNSTCQKVIQPGSCVLYIQFSPNKIGEKNAFMTIVEEGSKNLIIGLKGKGKENVVVGPNPNPNPNPTPTPVPVPTCVEDNEILVESAPKTEELLKSAVLPYFKISKTTKNKLGVLYGTESNSALVGATINTVSDAMVVTSFMTGNKAKVTLQDIFVEVDLAKLEVNSHNDTEMLCISSAKVKKCSGRLFDLATWIKLKNPAFFNIYKTPVTRTYENKLSAKITNCGDERCEFLKDRLSLKSILKLSEKELEDLRTSPVVHFVLTDDTRNLSIPKLILKTKEASKCQKIISK